MKRKYNTKDIDTSLFCKIERGECRAKRRKNIVITKTLKNQNKFLTLWLADQIIEVIEDKKEMAVKALNVA